MEYSRMEPEQPETGVANMAEDRPHINNLLGSLPPVAEPAVAVTRRLAESGHAAYLVGGAVRDLILGIEPGDFDVATAALPERIGELFPETKFVGAAFGVTLVRSGDRQVEVATFRREGVYLDGRHPERVEFSTDAAVDAQRRDFTVNALYLDPQTGDILDFVGGVEDCRSRVLRTVGDPDKRFGEDGLRLLRAARFAAACGLVVTAETETAMNRCRHMLKAVSPERIAQELTRMLTGPSPSRALTLLRETGMLDEFLPEIAALYGVPQPPDYHPEGDVWTHTLLMLDELDHPDVSLALAVMLHDVGKPSTLRHADGRIRFHGHEHVGQEMTREILGRLRYSRTIIDMTASLVGGHMKFFDAPRMRPATLKRFLRRDHFADLLELHRLDKLAADGDLGTYEFCLARRRDLSSEELSPPPLLTGTDLLEMGIPPGPRIGDLLEALETEQLAGRLRDVETAREWIRERFGESID